MNDARGNRTGPVRSGSGAVHTIPNRYVLFQKQPDLESNRVIMRFRSKNVADPVNGHFKLGAECSKTLSDTECITFRIGAFQLVIVTGIVLDHRGEM